MITTPLTPWDYCVVKRLFQNTFLCNEEKYISAVLIPLAFFGDNPFSLSGKR